MKICIVTLYGENNYGNRLQNYALQHVLNSMGHEVKSLAVMKRSNKIKEMIKKYVKKNGSKIYFINSVDRKRDKEFSNFTRKYINTEYIYDDYGLIPNEAGDGDCYIVGSDQVWNPLFWGDNNNAPELYNYMLAFTEKTKVSYAASFGISKLPEKWKEKFRPLINKLDFISVREKDAVNIVSDLGKSSEVVLDPTLLLSADEWRMIEKNVVKNKKYILLYFLGQKPNNMHFDRGTEVIDLFDINSKWYTSGPEIFVELIDKANMVYTDSFHATVFSMLFHTPFVVFNREHANNSDMSGRINTLLNIAGIGGKISNYKHDVINPNEVSDNNINSEKKQSLDFLKKSLTTVKEGCTNG